MKIVKNFVIVTVVAAAFLITFPRQSHAASNKTVAYAQTFIVTLTSTIAGAIVWPLITPIVAPVVGSYVLFQPRLLGAVIGMTSGLGTSLFVLNSMEGAEDDNLAGTSNTVIKIDP